MAVGADKFATTSVATWDWQNQHVQRNLNSGQFTNGKHVLICAGPPKLLHMNIVGQIEDDVLSFNRDDVAFPVGISDSMSVQSQKQWRRIFEIGSDRAYQLPGHTTYTGSMARVIYNGPSLLKVLYAYYGPKFPADSEFKSGEPIIASDVSSEMPEIYEAPGYGDMFFNLASDLFDQTTGMLLIFQDSKHNTIGSIYLEENAVTGHSLSIDANSPLLVEGCGFLPNRIVPVHVALAIRGKIERQVWTV